MATPRLFVGNLNYKTTAATLGQLFEKYGPVVEAVIVARGTFSQGYGFVTMGTAEAAQQAQKALATTELEGRTIHVEFARSTGPHPSGPRPAGSRPPRRGFRGRGRGFRGRGRGRGGRRPPVDPNAPTSQTRIYIRNLPFSLTDEQLKAGFEGYNVTEASVIRSNYNGRSRGYGFIECKTHEDQEKVLNEKKDMTFKDLRTQGERKAFLAPARERQPRTEAPAAEAKN